MSQVQLEFKSVTKRFRNPNDANLESITAIEGVTLRVKDGEVVSLIG
ncbi:MAG: ABC transporter ATP-binding protein, partial [Opitutae bacterium]|nr:ABC transporter ATP-binding protein [Opitutae bacterium]